jgi:hypothetical protein
VRLTLSLIGPKCGLSVGPNPLPVSSEKWLTMTKLRPQDNSLVAETWRISNYLVLNWLSYELKDGEIRPIKPCPILHPTLLSCGTYCDDYDHLLGNGQLERVRMSTKIQQRLWWIRVINKQFPRNLILGITKRFATTDRQGKNMNCSVWWSLFGSLEVIKESSFVNSRDLFVKRIQNAVQQSIRLWIINQISPLPSSD